MIALAALCLVLGWIGRMIYDAHEEATREDRKLRRAAREINRRQNRELNEWGPF